MIAAARKPPSQSEMEHAAALKLSLQCLSLLPRVEAFTAGPPVESRELDRPVDQLLPLAASSPVSSVTACSSSTGASSSSASASAGRSASSPWYDAAPYRPRARADADGVASQGLLRRTASAADGRGERSQALTLYSPPPAAAEAVREEARDFGEFVEDDFTDRFDSVQLNFDRDAALDEYMFLSQRCSNGVKKREEVRKALPRKRGGGEAIWERSMQLGVKACTDIARRARSQGDFSFRGPIAGKTEPAESVRIHVDEFLEFQHMCGVSARRSRRSARMLGGVKRFFRGLGGRRRRWSAPAPVFDDLSQDVVLHPWRATS